MKPQSSHKALKSSIRIWVLCLSFLEFFCSSLSLCPHIASKYILISAYSVVSLRMFLLMKWVLSETGNPVVKLEGMGTINVVPLSLVFVPGKSVST